METACECRLAHKAADGVTQLALFKTKTRSLRCMCARVPSGDCHKSTIP